MTLYPNGYVLGVRDDAEKDCSNLWDGEFEPPSPPPESFFDFKDGDPTTPHNVP